jgi:hypothetical protein
MVADIRGEGPRVSRTLPDTGDGDQKMNSMAKSRVIVVVLAVATGLAANAQEQPVEQKQQTKQNQRMFYQRVYRYDQETMLEDPAITNRVTDEQILPDSNEQNIESRVLTLDDLQWTRFVPAPVASEGMEFVPGKGYVAGRTEQATEPGMSVLAPTLGFEATGGLKGGGNSPNAEPLTGVNPGESGPDFVPSKAAVDPYAEPPDPLLSLDPFRAGMSGTGISSALEHRSAASLPVPEPSLLQNALTEPSQRSTTGELSAHTAPLRRSGPGRVGRTTCQLKVNPATIHDRMERERLSREGCLTRPVAPQNGKHLSNEPRD